MLTKEELQEVIDTLGLIGLHAMGTDDNMFRMADWKLSEIADEARRILVASRIK